MLVALLVGAVFGEEVRSPCAGRPQTAIRARLPRSARPASRHARGRRRLRRRMLRHCGGAMEDERHYADRQYPRANHSILPRDPNASRQSWQWRGAEKPPAPLCGRIARVSIASTKLFRVNSPAARRLPAAPARGRRDRASRRSGCALRPGSSASMRFSAASTLGRALGLEADARAPPRPAPPADAAPRARRGSAR